MVGFRVWFRHHWFVGVLVILGGVWLVTTLAYLLGAQSISFGNRYGRHATIDFQREHDHLVVGLQDGVGLQVDTGALQLMGSVIALKNGIPGLCWVCGSRTRAEGICRVEYRQGDWFYRSPTDLSNNSEVLRGRPQSRDFMRTLAFNRATNERLLVEANTSLTDQGRLLNERGLTRADRARLSPETLADLSEVSMQREGCVVVQLAFAACTLLWLLLGGSVALVAGRLKQRPAV